MLYEIRCDDFIARGQVMYFAEPPTPGADLLLGNLHFRVREVHADREPPVIDLVAM